jgi:aminopeptidase N
MASIRPRMGSALPTAPRHSLSAQEVYGSDIYFKGAWVLHTLRYLVGEEALREALRVMAYPSEDAAWETSGAQVRFASTADVVTVFEAVADRDLDWLFDAYLRQAELPELIVQVEGGDGDRQMELRWRVPSDLPFPMPVPVRLGDRTAIVDMADGSATLTVPAGVEPEIDPENWVLRASP